MPATLIIYSNKKGEINKFLSNFYNTNLDIDSEIKWTKKYANPIELADIIGVFIDNSDLYELQLYVCIDKDLFISIDELNGNDFIKYLYERYPY